MIHKLLHNRFGLQKILTCFVLVVLVLSIFVGLVSFPFARADLSYTVSKSGAYTLVSLGGSVVYNSSNSVLAFNYVFGQVASGGTVTVQAGTYVGYKYASGLTVTGYTSFTMRNCSNVNVVFEPGANLTLADAQFTAVFTMFYCMNCNLTNIQINGNGGMTAGTWGVNGNNTPYYNASTGIDVWDSTNCWVVNANITNCQRDGYNVGSDDSTNYGCGIRDSVITYCGSNGFTLQGWRNVAYNNTVSHCSDVGGTTWGGVGCKFYNNTVTSIDQNHGSGGNSHYGYAIEYGASYTWAYNNSASSCAGSGLSFTGGLITNNNYVAYNTFSNCGTGIGVYYTQNDVITRNVITQWGDWYGAGILFSGTNIQNEIISFNTLTNVNTSATLGYAAYLTGCLNCSFYNNTITTELASTVPAIFMQSGVNNTDVEGNNIQAYVGIQIYDASCTDNRFNQNTLSNCTTGYNDAGTGSLWLSPATIVKTTVFQDLSGTAGNGNSWTAATATYPTSPKYTGNTYSMKINAGDSAHFNYVSALANPIISTVFYIESSTVSGDKTNILFNVNGWFDVFIDNSTGTCVYTVDYYDSGYSLKAHSFGTPVIGSWVNLTVAWQKDTVGGFQVWLNGTSAFNATEHIVDQTIASFHIANSVSAGSGINGLYFSNSSSWYQTGSAGVTTNSSLLTLNCPSLNGSASLSAGRYVYATSASQSLSFTADTYFSGLLNVDGTNYTSTQSLNMSNSHVAYVLFELSSSPPGPTPTPTPTATPTPPPASYSITVISQYGSPTANATVTAGSDYATSVSSPYSGTVGTRYVCSGYSIDNAGAGMQYTGTSYTFVNVQANHTVWYYWATQFYVTVTSAYGSPTGAGWYNSGASASISINSPVSGGVGVQYIFNGFVGSGSGSYTGSSNSTTITVNAPITETANWVTQYYLTVTSLYGVTSGSGWYNSGTSAYAGLDNGTQIVSGITYTFSGWSTGGSNYTQSDPITMSSALTVVAYWIPGPNQYIITASAGAGGSISPSGSIVVSEGASATFTITANTGYQIGQVLVNGLNVGAVSSYTFSNVTADQKIVASFLSSYGTAKTQNVTLYFRNDLYTFNNVSGYGLDTDYTSTHTSISISGAGNGNVTYGFRVYLVTSSTVSTELTAGAPSAYIFLSNNFTGAISSSWVCPETTVILGYQCLQVDIYVSTDGGVNWVNQAVFVSNVLMTKEIENTLWTFTLNVNSSITSTITQCSFTFGDSTYRSGINGLTILSPRESDLQAWRLSKGDLVGFEIGAYYDIIGEGIYALLLLLFAAVLYFRYGHFGTVAFFFVLFGGGGGLVTLFIPLWAAIPVWALVIVGTSFMVWRVIR